MLNINHAFSASPKFVLFLESPGKSYIQAARKRGFHIVLEKPIFSDEYSAEMERRENELFQKSLTCQRD